MIDYPNKYVLGEDEVLTSENMGRKDALASLAEEGFLVTDEDEGSTRLTHPEEDTVIWLMHASSDRVVVVKYPSAEAAARVAVGLRQILN